MCNVDNKLVSSVKQITENAYFFWNEFGWNTSQCLLNDYGVMSYSVFFLISWLSLETNKNLTRWKEKIKLLHACEHKNSCHPKNTLFSTCPYFLLTYDSYLSLAWYLSLLYQYSLKC